MALCKGNCGLAEFRPSLLILKRDSLDRPLTFPLTYGKIPLLKCRCFQGRPHKVKNGECVMERIKTLETRNLCESAKNGGCGECQTSCQSACKTSCGVANQKCENTAK